MCVRGSARLVLPKRFQEEFKVADDNHEYGESGESGRRGNGTHTTGTAHRHGSERSGDGVGGDGGGRYKDVGGVGYYDDYAVKRFEELLEKQHMQVGNSTHSACIDVLVLVCTCMWYLRSCVYVRARM